MQIKKITNRDEWKHFVLRQPYTLFVQSPSYGEFYEKMGEQSWMFGIYEADKLIGGSLVVSTHAKRGNFLYLPYGPVFGEHILADKEKLRTALKAFVDFLKGFAKKQHYDFIRLSPFLDETKQTKQLFQSMGLRDAPMHMLAETTWMLDITPSQDKLLSTMGKNHRNLIRRCMREGVRIEMKTDTEALKRFNDMHDTVAKRHSFHRFSPKYIANEFQAFVGVGECVIFEAYLPDGRLDSSSIIIFFGGMANYRHSASLNLNKKLPTSYLIQWEVIKEAKKRGFVWYNLWGIAPQQTPKDHPFRGITHFKRGFGGFQKDLLHCHDVFLSWKYWLNWTVETFRRVKRGF